ncbi:MAG: hypothetical protein O7B99_07180 [Planctomycetota bacterium]|nr:hypothetical protein [Planctomycetota bacterium]
MDSSIRRLDPYAAASTSRVRSMRRRTGEEREGERDFAAELEERREGTKRDAQSERKAAGGEQPPTGDHGVSDDGDDAETGGSLDVIA